jgi:hypothetical protein
MTTAYMPADSSATCAAVSYAVYHLSQSPAMAVNVTKYAFGWRQAVNGSWWMEWYSDMVLPVHPERSNELTQVLAGFVAAGHLTQTSADAVTALAASREGSAVTLAEVTPPEWAALMLTEEQAAGMWPSASETPNA